MAIGDYDVIIAVSITWIRPTMGSIITFRHKRHLATITSEAENSFILTTFGASGIDG